MDIFSANTQQTIQKSLQYVLLNEEFAIYRWSVLAQNSSAEASPEVFKEEGYALAADVLKAAETLETYNGVSLPFESLPYGICLLPGYLVELASQYSFHDTYDYYPGNRIASRDRSEKNEIGEQMYAQMKASQKPFTCYTHLSQDERSRQKLYLIDHGNFCVYELGEKLSSPLTPVRYPLPYHYIHGHTDNSRYELASLATHLLNNPSVIFQSRPKSTKEMIQPIPWYNADKFRNSFIRFNALLSHSDFAKACEHAFGTLSLNDKGGVQSSKSRHITSDCLRDVIEKYDMLGMGAFKKTETD